MNLSTPREFESLSYKMKNASKLISMLYLDEKILIRFKLIMNTENMDYSIEDSITKKIYQGDTYDIIFKNIKADLRREKIQKLLSN